MHRSDLGRGAKGRKQQCASDQHTDSIYTSEGDEGENDRRKCKLVSAQRCSETHTWSTTHAQPNGPKLQTNIPYGGKLCGEQGRLKPRGCEW